MDQQCLKRGARPGQIVGQGLMGAGHIASDIFKEQGRQRERKEESQLKKTIALMNMYTKMGDQITDPAQKMRFYTGVVFPIFAKSGLFPEGIDKEEAKKGLATMATMNEGHTKGFRQDLDRLGELATTPGKEKEAIKFANGMKVKYAHIPLVKDAVNGLVAMAKNELTEGRKIASETRQEERGTKGLVATGKTTLAQEGDPGAVKLGGLMVKAPESGEVRPKNPKELLTRQFAEGKFGEGEKAWKEYLKKLEDVTAATGKAEGKTSYQKNIPYLSKILGVPKKEVAEILIYSKDKSPEATYIKLWEASLRPGFPKEKAKENANEAFKAIYGYEWTPKDMRAGETKIPDWRDFQREKAD